MLDAINERPVKVKIKIAVLRRHFDDLFAFDEPLALTPIRDEILDAANLEPMLLLEDQQLWEPSRRAVGIEGFADHSGGNEPGKARQVDARFGVTRTAENAARFGAQREDVSGLNQILGRRL